MALCYVFYLRELDVRKVGEATDNRLSQTAPLTRLWPELILVESTSIVCGSIRSTTFAIRLFCLPLKQVASTVRQLSGMQSHRHLVNSQQDGLQMLAKCCGFYKPQMPS